MCDFTTRFRNASSAEDFLALLEVPYDPRVVAVNRLHILKRFHDYMARERVGQGEDAKPALQVLLQRAYQDFVTSNAVTEKVFKVFQCQPGRPAFVGLETLRR
jgi:nitrogenase-stabilizing/protective protein